MREKKAWTPHKYIIAAARKAWRWAPQHKVVLQRASVNKGFWKCEKCLDIVSRINYITRRGRKARKIDGAVDHIQPLGLQPQSWNDYVSWFGRLFCPIENLMFLCTHCHSIKSAAEAAQRAVDRKRLKDNA